MVIMTFRVQFKKACSLASYYWVLKVFFPSFIIEQGAEVNVLHYINLSKVSRPPI